MNETVRLEWPDDGYARIVLARPDKKNALRHEELRGLARVTEILAKRAPRVVSILGEGTSFGVGGDIYEFADALDRGQMERWLRDAGNHLNAAITRLRALDAAVIVGIQGPVAGGTLGLVWNADHVIAADNLQMNLAYARLGASPDAGTSWFLPRLVNPLRAFEMFALAPTLNAEQALNWGLVNRVVPTLDVAMVVNKVVQQLLTIPPQSLKNIKRLLHRSLNASLESQLYEEIEAFVLSVEQPEFAEKVTRFLHPKK